MKSACWRIGTRSNGCSARCLGEPMSGSRSWNVYCSSLCVSTSRTMCTKLLAGKPKTVMSVMDFSPLRFILGKLGEFARKPRSPSAHEAQELAPPERFFRLAQRLFLRDADVLQKVKIVAFGDLAQRAALA